MTVSTSADPDQSGDPLSAVPSRRFRPPGRKRILLILAAVVLLVGGAWGIRHLQYSRSHETTDNAQVEGHVVPVIPKVGGYIARVYVEDNQLVREGDTLVTLDPRDFEVRLAQAEAEAAAARIAAGGGARAVVSQAEAQRRALAADTAAAAATYNKALRDVQRFRALAAGKAISQSQLDAAEATFRSAEADLAASRNRALASEASVEGASASGRSANARLMAAEAAAQTARLQRDYAVITAPGSGRIARRTAEPGQLVQPGQLLMAVVDDHNAWVVANLKETQLDRVRVGQPVEVTIDAYPDHTFLGRVESIQGATGARFALLPPDNATGNFTKVVQRVPVKIALDSIAGFELRPGLSAEASIDITGDSASSH